MGATAAPRARRCGWPAGFWRLLSVQNFLFGDWAAAGLGHARDLPFQPWQTGRASCAEPLAGRASAAGSAPGRCCFRPSWWSWYVWAGADWLRKILLKVVLTTIPCSLLLLAKGRPKIPPLPLAANIISSLGTRLRSPRLKRSLWHHVPLENPGPNHPVSEMSEPNGSTS